MNKNVYCIVFIIVLLCPFLSNGQANISRQPIYYSKSNESYSNFIKIPVGSVDKNKPWIVCADRERDTTYIDSNLKAPTTRRVELMQPFYVIGEWKGRLHVARADWSESGLGVDNKISIPKEYVSALDYGWIDAGKVVLWDKSWENLSTSCAVKGIIISHKPIGSGYNGLINSYRTPYSQKYFSDTTFGTFNIVYVYKKINKKYLVGEFSRLNIAGMNKNPSFMWIDSTDLEIWKTNLCIDINDDPAAREQMKSAKVHPAWFSTEAEAAIWAVQPQIIKPLDQRNYDDFCKEGNDIRPVLLDVNETNHNLVKISGVNSYFDTTSAAARKRIRDSIGNEQLISYRRYTNVVFLIDNKNFKQAEGVMKNIMRDAGRIQIIRNHKLVKNNMRYGCVIYDQLNSNDHIIYSGDLRDSTSFIHWFNVMCKTAFFNTSFHGARCIASFPAIDTALGLFNNDYSYNILVMLGKDCNTKIPENQVFSEAIIDKSVNIEAFQLSTPGDLIHENFFTLTKGMIDACGNGYINALKKRFPESCAHCTVRFEKYKDQVNHYWTSSHPLWASVKCPSPSMSLQSQPISDYLCDVIRKRKVKDEEMYEYHKDEGFKPIAADSLVPYLVSWKELITHLGKEGVHDTALMRRLNIGLERFLTPVYTSMQVRSSDSITVFKRYVFASSTEYDALLSRFKLVDSIVRGIDRRGRPRKGDKIYKYLRDITRDLIDEITLSYLGGKDVISRDTISNHPVADIISTVDKVSIYNPALSKILLDLNSKYDSIYSIASHFSRLYPRIENIKKEERFIYHGGKVTGRDLYYWIPEDYIVPKDY